VDECKPLLQGRRREQRSGDKAEAAGAGHAAVEGRGLHFSTFQLNLSQF